MKQKLKTKGEENKAMKSKKAHKRISTNKERIFNQESHFMKKYFRVLMCKFL